MSKAQKRKLALVISALFAGAMLFLVFIWLWANKVDDPVAGKAEKLPSVKKSAKVTRSPETESLLARDAAHRIVDEGAKILVEGGSMDIDGIVALKKSLEQADNDLASGKRDEAIRAYQNIERKISTMLDAQANKDEARRLGNELLGLLKEHAEYKDLVPAPYESAVGLSDQGQAALAEARYSDALKIFDEGIEQVKEVEVIANDLLDAIMRQAEEAISALRWEDATEALSRVIRYRSNDPEVHRLKALLSSIEALKPELAKAKAAMGKGHFEDALKRYEALVKSNPGIAFIEKKLEEAREAYRQARVQPLINESQKLFSEGEYEKSLELLTEAASLAPDDRSITQAITAVKEKIREEMIKAKLDEAYVFYEGFEWDEARRIYLEVLDLDPANHEAQKGSTETSKRLTEEIKYSSSMKQAEQYYNEGRFPKALKAFNQAVDAMPDYRKLSSFQHGMRMDLERQSKAVSITIKSDKKTWVSMIGALPPELLREKTMEVYPDVYTVRGQRKGYKDVLMEYPVNVNNLPIVLNVICTEKQ